MVEYSLRTDTGKRKVNEDSAIAVARKDGIFLFAVADGLGGHGKGDIASSFVTEFIKNKFLATDSIDSNFIPYIFEETQTALLKKKQKIKDSMSMLTTCALIIMDDKSFQFGYIGDSRIYVFKDGKAEIRSKDHSIPQMLVDNGDIDESEIRNHPDRNKIVRAIGINGMDFGYSVSEVIPYDSTYDFLICSDGLWEYVVEEDMEKYLKKSKKTPKKWISMMFSAVNKHRFSKNLDNYTAVAIQIKEDKK